MIKIFEILCFVGFISVMAHPYYRDRIPNGYAVSNPCGSGFWEAVGHYDPLHHTHDKNPFGLAFAAAGHQWTVDLCNADSDGDGVSNGAELGDPNCTWTAGDTPEGKSTGQPGICEPVGSGACSSIAFYCGCHGHACIG
ncbi:temptin-like isoform X1 [Saccostrea echinata]|uniref:temptin-like isoform X1 n=1 Tax=Saccostrea echinata TaxID=191078 RepID=UPI002A8315C8|nr:temptin-like isoform X1 [Saccostrea echinata]